MKTIKYSLIIAVAVLVSISFGQPPGPGPWGENGPRRERMRQRIKIIKISQLTEAVGLTSEQSEKFFPIYNEHQKEHEKLQEKRQEVIEKLRDLGEKDNPSESEIRVAIDELTALDSRFASLRGEFINDLSGVLSIKQVAKLMVFEHNFMQRLQENIRDIRRGMGERRGNLRE
jgi:Spy/CpxP family protein refolding chaperone